MELLPLINTIDKLLVLAIHNDSDHYILDSLMLTLRNPITWAPLYLFLIIWTIKKYPKHLIEIIGITILTIALADFISASILKPFFQRLRPLHDPLISSYFRELINPGGLYSFPSTHATNHFALAVIWNKIFYQLSKKKANWLYLWASIICYAQVYVGKHYPTDIIAGTILGSLIASLVHSINNSIKKMSTNLLLKKDKSLATS